MKVIVNEEQRKHLNDKRVSTVDLIKDKVYEVLKEIKKGDYYHRYEILDESGEVFRYPPSLFDIVEE